MGKLYNATKKKEKKRLELQPFCQLTKTLMVLFLLEQIQIVSFSDLKEAFGDVVISRN